MMSSLSVNILPNESDDEDEEERNEEPQLKDLQEQSSKGTVQGSLLFNYLLAGGNIVTVTTICILYIFTQIMASGSDYFISYWVSIEEFRTTNNVTIADKARISQSWSTETCLYIYGSMLIVLFVAALTRSMFFYKVAMWSSQKLHYSIFSSVIRATMRFFDTNPSGRILNRFSKDLGSIDEWLPKVILDAGQVSVLTG